MSTIKSMKIVSLELAKDTMIPAITIHTDSNLCGVGATFENAIRDIIIEEYAEDWKIINQLNAMSLVELANKYGICVTNEVYTQWKDVPNVDNGEFKALPIMVTSLPIVLTKIRNLSDGPMIKVKGEFAYMNQLHRFQANSSANLIYQVAVSVYGEDAAAQKTEGVGNIADMVKAFNIQIDPKLNITDLYNQQFTEMLSEIIKNTPNIKQGEKKLTKLARITLQDIDLNPNKDWVITLIIENELTAPFNIKYIVTSRNNTDSPHRSDAIAITGSQIINSLPLTMEKENELRQSGDEKFRDHFTLVTATHLKGKAFPKNNHGAQMLNLLAWFETVPAPDAISALVKVMFESDAWDPDMQGMKNISGKAEDGEVAFRICHAVGNFFVEGTLETVKVRIFKNHSSIQTYFHPQEGTWADTPVTYNINYKDDFENHLRSVVKAEIFNRNNQAK